MIRHLLHRHCDAQLTMARLDAQEEAKRADRWREEALERQDEVWELTDKVIDRVPFWMALAGTIGMLWIGVWIGSAL